MNNKGALRGAFLFGIKMATVQPKTAFPLAPPSNKVAAAEQLLSNQVRLGADRQKQIVDRVSNMHIVDALVHPRDLTFACERKLEVTVKGQVLSVHPHALGQIASVLEYPHKYLVRLQAGRLIGVKPSLCRDKLRDDLNWHATHAVLKNRKRQDAKYLIRFVDNEIRGFLTQSYKRHLASKPLMRAFLHACDHAGLAPIDGHASPVRVNLQCALPYVFEPIPGEFIAVGLAWTNSDFGGGRMKVSMFMRRINNASSFVLNDAISEVHIGPVIEEADIELSKETSDAELDAQKLAINDAVHEQVNPQTVQSVLDAISIAHEEKIPWAKLNGELSRILHKAERDHILDILSGTVEGGLETLPPIDYDDDDDPLPSRWWASTVVGQLAEKELNAERKKELQEFAGQMLGKAAQKKKKTS